MRTNRIYIPANWAVGDEIELPASAAEHLVRVLRLSTGATISCFNGDGFNYTAELKTGGRGKASVLINEKVPGVAASPLRIHLAQSLARGDKMDFVIQKSVELGVAEITPLESEHTEVKLKGERAEKRLQHWQNVVESACEQCGRSELPRLNAIQSIAEFAAAMQHKTYAKLIFEPCSENTLASTSLDSEVVFLIGPEGGFSERDLACANAANFQAVVVGPRLLRTETAGPAVIAALQALHGDWR